MGSSFGQLFRISTFGESHGGAVGVILEGCPPRLTLDLAAIQAELDRRRPGQSRITTPRKEDDRVEILSGLLDGVTLGTPIALVVRNQDQRPQDYREMEVAFRPSHADATYQAKYGIQARSGAPRASARETIGRVAAGAIAKQLLAHVAGTEVLAWVRRIHTIEASIDPATVSLEAVEANIVRCPDGASAERMIERIEAIGRDGDSCGGVIECLVRRPPVGLGMPVFDKLEADLAKAVMSLPATKGFEIGSGFSGSLQRGSEHNDAFIATGDGSLRMPVVEARAWASSLGEVRADWASLGRGPLARSLARRSFARKEHRKSPALLPAAWPLDLMGCRSNP